MSDDAPPCRRPQPGARVDGAGLWTHSSVRSSTTLRLRPSLPASPKTMSIV